MKKYFLRFLGTFFIIFSLLTAGEGEISAFQVSTGQGTLILILRLSKNYEFIPEAPFSIEIGSATPEAIAFPVPSPERFNPLAGYTKIPFTASSGTALVTIRAKLFYCDKSSKICLQDTRETRLTFEIAPEGSSSPIYLWDINPKTDPE